MTPLRILFVKEAQNWPRTSGNDVHGYHMMKALIARGHAVSLATMIAPSPQALEGLPLQSLHLLDALSNEQQPHTLLQRRFLNYYGVRIEYGTSLARASEGGFDVVVLVARHLLPLLNNVKVPVRVWYPADDPAWHHLTRFHWLKPGTWGELVKAAINVLYEHACRSCCERVWVVSASDKKAARFFVGCRDVDLIPNGVDADHYRPRGEAEIPASCAFWGRLDFDPNVDALEWFIARIWPAVMRRTPAASLSLFGLNPRPRVKELARTEGVELHSDLPDLRPEVTRRQVAILPFVSGGGIKNKLLEAAALGMPIVCTSRALSGTKGTAAVRVCRSAAQWAESLAQLWSSPAARQELGSAARQWVTEHHTWEAAAKSAELGLLETLERGEPGEPAKEDPGERGKSTARVLQ